MISKPSQTRALSHLAPPETIRAELASETDPNVRAKASGIIYWDLCDLFPAHAAAAAEYRPKFPVETCDTHRLYKLLRRCGYSVRWAKSRSVLAKIKGGGILNAKKVRNPPRRKNEI